MGTSLLARFPRDKFDLVLVTGDARLKGALNRATAHQLSIELCPISLPAAPGSALAAAPGWRRRMGRGGGARASPPLWRGVRRRAVGGGVPARKTAIDDAARSTTSSSSSGAASATRKGGGEGGVAADPVLRVVDVGAGALSMLRPMAAAAVRAGARRLPWPSTRWSRCCAPASPPSPPRRALRSKSWRCRRSRPPPPRARRSRTARDDRARRRDAARPEVGVELLVLRADPLSWPATAADLAPAWAALGGGGGGGFWALADVIVACGFADLLAPSVLSGSSPPRPGALCYLPITFVGRTWLEPAAVPARPGDVCALLGRRSRAGRRRDGPGAQRPPVIGSSAFWIPTPGSRLVSAGD